MQENEGEESTDVVTVEAAAVGAVVAGLAARTGKIGECQYRKSCIWWCRAWDGERSWVYDWHVCERTETAVRCSKARTISVLRILIS